RRALPASSSESASEEPDAPSSESAASTSTTSTTSTSDESESASASESERDRSDDDEDPVEHASEEEERGLPFGELALLKELVTREQLESALRAQGNRREREDRAPKIATILVREG